MSEKTICCPNCEIALPCSKYCPKCGKLLNPKFPINPSCHFNHLGYKSEGGHRFCPECGETLIDDKNSAKIISAGIILKGIGLIDNLPQKKSEKFIPTERCPHCQSFSFSIIYGGKFKKRCNNCGKSFQENNTTR